MESLISKDVREIESGIVSIYRLLELRKLHYRHISAGKMCDACNSFCHELGLQKQTKDFIEKYHI